MQGEGKTLPVGVVSFLFTDMEGSTRLLQRVGGDAYERLLADHHRILREAVAQHDGHEINVEGEGFFFAFARATDAVAAAVDAQQALAGQTWDEDGAVRVRMGIHTGEAKLVDDDYVGFSVHQAARVSASAHGGQVLLSQATADLLAHDAPVREALLDLGVHCLRDIVEPVRLFQVVHPELKRDFPPPRTLTELPHNLPAQLTSFVGRGREVAEIRSALETDRVVTLTGVGGVGKTRLALRVAEETLAENPDGVWFVELGAIADPDSLPHLVASTLDVQPRQGLSVVESTIDALRTKQLLLVLDNCEHMLEPVARFVEDITQRCARVKILCTSREGLAVPGERLFAIRSLALPPTDAKPDEVVESDAARLFVDRARALCDDFNVGVANAGPIAEICRRLDGVPLAIELAVARLRSMTPQDIASRLDERFRLLTGGRRTSVERHQTLRSTVDWSYSLLSENERLLFDRVSVFAGGFTLGACESICGGDGVDSYDVVDILTSLVDKSMVAADATATETRYSLLETLRQYGRERLNDRGESDRIREKHARYFTALAEEGGEGVMGADEAKWSAQLAAEFDNLRVAYSWVLAVPDALDLAIRITTSLRQYGGNRMVPEAIAWAEQLIALDELIGHSLRPLAFAMASVGAWTRGEMAASKELAQQGMAILEPGDDYGRLNLLFALGGVELFEGNTAETLAIFAEIGEIGRSARHQFWELQGAGVSAMTLAYKGDFDAALPYLERVEELVTGAENPSTQALAHYCRAEVIADRDPGEAIRSGERAIEIAQSVGNRFLLGVAMVSVASLRGRHGDPVQALHAFDELVLHWYRVGNWSQQWHTLRNLVELFARIGADEQSATLQASVEAADTASPAFGPHGERQASTIAAVRERLGAEATTAAERRGRGMSGDQVVHFALDEIQTALRERAAVSA